MIVFTVPADDPDGMAFIRELYRRYARLMFAEALRRVSNPQDCEDIVQDAVESLCKKADTLRELPSAALPAYVVYTVKHKAFDFLRRQAVAGKYTADPEDGWLEDLESPAPSPEELAELREQTDGLCKVWPLLAEEDQELLYRKYILGQDNGELAEVFHCQRDSMRMRLTRARRRAAALELARTVTGQYTQLDIRQAGETGGRTLGEYFKRVDVAWLPEGFTHCGGEYDAWAEFEDGRGGNIRVEIYPEDAYVDLYLKNPDRSEGLSIDGNSGMLWEKDGEMVLSLDNFSDGFHFVVRTRGGVPAATATRVLANLRLHHGAGYFDNAEITWLPEGFTYRESRYNWYVKYQDWEGRWLWVYLYDGAGSLHIDTEGADYVEDVSINGNEGLCVVKNGYVHVVTTDLAHGLYIDVIASDGLSVTTVNRVVENIRILP